MQRWTFPSFFLPTGITTSTNSHPKSSTHPKPTHPPQVKTQPHPRTNRSRSRSQGLQSTQATYTPSPKHSQTERTLHSRITKLKAHNNQLRQNIAKLESQSVYLRRLKELEKEVDQLRKEGRELALREEEVKLVVERDEKAMEGLVREDLCRAEEDGGGWIEDQEEDNDWIGGGGNDGIDDDGDGCVDRTSDEGTFRGRTSDEGTFREGSVRREAKDLKEEREGRVSVWQLKVEEGSLVGKEGEADDEVKQEVEREVNDLMNKWMEEHELLSGTAAWIWSDSRLAEEI